MVLALDLNFDGLMIETHTDPDNAWSDAAQQITPDVLVKMMEDLKIRTLTSDEADYKNQLNTLRTQIDVIDHGILETLGKRMKVAVSIGELKKKKNVAVLQTKRWNEILGNMILEGEKKGLSEEFVLKMFKAIHQESINNLEINIESTVADQRAIDAKVEKHLADNSDLTDALGDVQARFYSLGNDIARIEQSIEHHLERVDQLKLDLTETEDGWSQSQEELNIDLRKITQLDAGLKSITCLLYTSPSPRDQRGSGMAGSG